MTTLLANVRFGAPGVVFDWNAIKHLPLFNGEHPFPASDSSRLSPGLTPSFGLKEEDTLTPYGDYFAHHTYSAVYTPWQISLDTDGWQNIEYRLQRVELRSFALETARGETVFEAAAWEFADGTIKMSIDIIAVPPPSLAQALANAVAPYYPFDGPISGSLTPRSEYVVVTSAGSDFSPSGGLDFVWLNAPSGGTVVYYESLDDLLPDPLHPESRWSGWHHPLVPAGHDQIVGFGPDDVLDFTRWSDAVNVGVGAFTASGRPEIRIGDDSLPDDPDVPPEAGTRGSFIEVDADGDGVLDQGVLVLTTNNAPLTPDPDEPLKLIVGVEPLFDDGSNTVDFERLTSGQAEAYKGSWPGPAIRNARGGDDVVALPGRDAAITLEWPFEAPFRAGAGSDTIRGRDGNDRIGDWAIAGDTSTIDGGDGNDLVFFGLGIGDTASVGVIVNRPDYVRSPGDLRMFAEVSNVESIIGSPHDDFIRIVRPDGSWDRLTVTGRGGSDMVLGSDGPDALYGDHPGVVEALLLGFEGPQGDATTDFLYGGLGQDVLRGGAGADHLWAGSVPGVDQIFGSAVTPDDAWNELFGEEGDDFLHAWTDLPPGALVGDRADRLDGGKGRDSYFVDNLDLIVNFEVGETAYIRTAERADHLVFASNAIQTYIEAFVETAGGARSLGRVYFGNEMLKQDLRLTEGLSPIHPVVKVERVEDALPRMIAESARSILEAFRTEQLKIVIETVVTLAASNAKIGKKAADAAVDRVKPLLDAMISDGGGKDFWQTYIRSFIENTINAGLGKAASEIATNPDGLGEKTLADLFTMQDLVEIALFSLPPISALSTSYTLGKNLVQLAVLEARLDLALTFNERFPRRDSDGVFLLDPGTGAFTEGTTVDGYVAGATIFGDVDGDLTLNAGEPVALTDGSGRFSIAAGGSRLVSLGGVDAATGNPVAGAMWAAPGSSVISPLTTLAEIMGSDRAAAEALGLDPTLAFGSFDHFGQALGGDAAGLAVTQAAAMVAAIVAGAAKALTASGAIGVYEAAEAAYRALADVAGAVAGSPLDLSSAVTVRSVIDTAAGRGGVAVGDDLAAAVAGGVAAANGLIAAASSSEPPEGVLSRIYAILEAAQDILGPAGSSVAGDVASAFERLEADAAAARDMRAPALVGVDGSLLAGAVVLSFDEPVVLPAAGGFRVVTGSGDVIAVDAAVRGTDVVLTPSAPLTPGASARVEISSAAVADGAGNAFDPTGAGALLTFRVGPDAGIGGAPPPPPAGGGGGGAVGAGPATPPAGDPVGFDGVGSEGPDRWLSGPGDEAFDGGGGVDVVAFPGLSRDYVVEVGRDGLPTTVTGPAGSDTVRSIERLEFEDGVMAFDHLQVIGQVGRLYVAAFGRDADPPGGGFWATLLAGGDFGLVEIARHFIASPEFADRFGDPSAQSDAEYLDIVYRNVLRRDPDAGGFAFWLDRLADGMGRDHLLASFSESPECRDLAGEPDARTFLLDPNTPWG
ncbi:DUF4214 domain-containing protein [Salinarimonas ramus]|uniref:DUF4214 domain-containing protein n=1 Tax=Salinarimonas ramus TaxID=690164 RepID=A0A917QEU5_9HYPH|nr:DUF4214 domain-containing protein [Salinarimonas ramus]GGK47284.1 hypothetical protein GCM10011322_37960 [Salinarimonas ramus]